MKKIITLLSLIVAGLFFMASYANASIIANGDMSDWGVTPGVWGTPNMWVPNNGAIYNPEDQNTDKLGPGYGGQKFDAEAIYFVRENGYVCVAIVTGHPAGGYGGHYPGDVFFNFGAGMEYGLETTGTNAGRLYKNPVWNMSSYWGSLNSETTMQDGTWEKDMGLAGFAYAFTYDGAGVSNDHWVIEMKIPNSFFGDNWNDSGTVHWTETCGNDAIDLDFPSTPVPEPATMSLLGLGLAGLIGARRKKIRRE